MTGLDAVRAGFRRLAEQPLLLLGEITWRWSFGIAISLLVAVAQVEWLDSIVIFGPAPSFGPWARLGIIAAILIGGFGLLSSLASGFGRSATVPLLFRTARARERFSAQLGLAFFRATLALATLLGYASAWILTNSTSGQPFSAWPTGIAFVAIFLPLAVLVTAISLFLHLILTLGSLQASVNADHAMTAISAAVTLLNRRTAEVATIAAVFLLFRALVIGVALTVALAALQLAHSSSAAAFATVVTGALVFVTVSDFLFISRMATYAAVIEDDLLGRSRMAPPLPATPPGMELPDATFAES